MCNNVIAVFMHSKIVSAQLLWLQFSAQLLWLQFVQLCSAALTVKGGQCTLCGMLWLCNRVVFTIEQQKVRKQGVRSWH